MAGNLSANTCTVSALVTGGECIATSDIKFKKDMDTVDNPIETVMKLMGITWDWKANDQTAGVVVAQELQEILPYAVRKNEKGLAVNYNCLHGYLIEAIKEQQKLIESQQKSIDLLNQRMIDLESKITN